MSRYQRLRKEAHRLTKEQGHIIIPFGYPNQPEVFSKCSMCQMEVEISVRSKTVWGQATYTRCPMVLTDG